jgi:branched-chain amino acid aminotransferase
MKAAFFKGKIVPFDEAKISVMTHAFNYGTASLEGIRGYYNAEKKQMFILKMEDHYKRLFKSCSIIKVNIKYSLEELKKTTLELVRKNGYKEDVYIRPIAYKSQEKIGLGLSGIEDDLCIFLAPFGKYLDTSKGISVCVSSWQRVNDNAIPARGKITGAYINSSLAKSEAIENGFAEAIMLSSNGHVSEGSGENLFMVRDNVVVTPQVSDDILEGVTRKEIIQLIRDELNLEIVKRTIDRSELYVADEIFLCGTGAEIVPVLEVDRRKVGSGTIGPVTKEIQKIYFSAVRGENKKYLDWVTPV